MLSAFIIGTTSHIVDYFHRACVGVPDLTLPHVLDEAPPLHQLMRMMSTHAPHVVFVEVDHSGRGYRLAVDILAAFPETRLIGFAGEDVETLLSEAREFGLAGVLGSPFDTRTTYVALQQTLKAKERRRASITLFQPATGGAGATTVAVNVASELAQRLDRRVLFLDADLRSSPLSFWFDVESGRSILDAVETCQSLDERTWRGLTAEVQGFDALFAPRRASLDLKFSSWDVMRVLSFAALRYDHIVVDMPVTPSSELEPLFSRADRNIVVCLPQTISATMGRRRLDEMQAIGAEPSALFAMLNRTGSGGMAAGEVEPILKVPILAELPDDGGGSTTSLFSALSSRRSRLVKGYRALAEVIDREAGGGPGGARGRPSGLKQTLAGSVQALW